MKSSAERG